MQYQTKRGIEMSRWIATMLISTSLFLSFPATSAGKPVKQPRNWGVSYQDASCIVMTNAADDTGDPTANQIKMGYLGGNQLLLLFSISNKQFSGLKLPDGTKARFTVDGKPFSAFGVRIVGDEIIYMVNNSMELQRALGHAKALGGEIKLPDKPSYVTANDLALSNIPDAVEWLDTCNVLGVGALP